MARFDVYRNEGGSGYLLDVQTDLLSGLNTRIVVPLLPRATAPIPAQRLNPVFKLDDAEMVMATQFMAAVPVAELGSAISNLEAQQYEISAALDMLFLGF